MGGFSTAYSTRPPVGSIHWSDPADQDLVWPEGVFLGVDLPMVDRAETNPNEQDSGPHEVTRDEKEYSICMDAGVVDETDCGHFFHTECLARWFAEQGPVPTAVGNWCMDMRPHLWLFILPPSQDAGPDDSNEPDSPSMPGPNGEDWTVAEWHGWSGLQAFLRGDNRETSVHQLFTVGQHMDVRQVIIDLDEPRELINVMLTLCNNAEQVSYYGNITVALYRRGLYT